MGGVFSRRVGSDPYYADYERVFKRLRAEVERLQKRRSDRKQTLGHVTTATFRYGSIGFVFAALLAAWVQQQPDGTFTTREHSLLVLPLFIEPAVAYLVYEMCHHLIEWRDAGDVSRLNMLQGKLRKMVTTLKDSTRFAKTQKLLQEYDPDYIPLPPKLPTPARQSPLKGVQGQAIRASAHSAHRGSSRGISLLPAFDKLAAGIIGDNPSLTEALRIAETEAAALRNRLATAEQWVRELANENAFLKAQLGQGPGLLLEGPTTETRPSQDGQTVLECRGGEAHPSHVEEPETPAVRRRASDVSGTPLSLVPQVGGYRSLTEGAECSEPIRSSSWTGFDSPSDRGRSPAPPGGTGEPDVGNNGPGIPSASQPGVGASESLLTSQQGDRPQGAVSLRLVDVPERGPSLEDHSGAAREEGPEHERDKVGEASASLSKLDVGAPVTGASSETSSWQSAGAGVGEGEEDQSWVLTEGMHSTGEAGSEAVRLAKSSDAGSLENWADRRLESPRHVMGLTELQHGVLST
eukprot:jgi/Botrbrau1/10759/Bobra.180_2s0024.1